MISPSSEKTGESVPHPVIQPSRLAPDFFGRVPAWFLTRVPGIDVSVDRETALARLWEYRLAQLAATGEPERPILLAEQVHGAEVAIVRKNAPLPTQPLPGADGLLTDRHDIWLGIYVADCAAVYLFDRAGSAAGLVHSGKKGTEAGIVPRALAAMQSEWGLRADRIGVWISPRIRPPHYELDFGEEILRQVQAAGVTWWVDCSDCTACSPETYYSYRRERGRTGRMLAVCGLPAEPPTTPS